MAVLHPTPRHEFWLWGQNPPVLYFPSQVAVNDDGDWGKHGSTFHQTSVVYNFQIHQVVLHRAKVLTLRILGNCGITPSSFSQPVRAQHHRVKSLGRSQAAVPRSLTANHVHSFFTPRSLTTLKHKGVSKCCTKRRGSRYCSEIFTIQKNDFWLKHVDKYGRRDSSYIKFQWTLQ